MVMLIEEVLIKVLLSSPACLLMRLVGASAISKFSKVCHFVMFPFTLVQRLEIVQDYHTNFTFSKKNGDKTFIEKSISQLRLISGLLTSTNERQRKIVSLLGESNPRLVQEAQLHSQKLTFWCRLWYSGVAGTYFGRNEAGNVLTINSEHYICITISTDFFVRNLMKSRRTNSI